MANTTTNITGNRLTGTPSTMRIPPNYPTEPAPGKVAQLLEYNQYNLYHYPTPFTENTSLLKFGRSQPYIYTYIDEKNKPILPPIPRGQAILQNQAIPIEPGTTDLVRISRYLTSGRGVEFLTKQLLLQAQQPFDETGLYNPLEVPLALASSTTLGIIPRPQRHINMSGGILGALASIIGINISNGNSIAPSSVGYSDTNDRITILKSGNTPNQISNLKSPLPIIGSKDGKGLLRGGTAIKARTIINDLWPDGPVRGAGRSGFFDKLLKSAAAMAVDTAKAFFKPAFPIRQTGKNYALYRQDEIMYDRMRADVPGRLTAWSKVPGSAGSYPVPIDKLRPQGFSALSNNRVYKSLDMNKPVMQNGADVSYLSHYEKSGTTVALVDTSLPNTGKNFRLARAGAGDGINQIGILDKQQPNDIGIPIKNVPDNYVGWKEWLPYQDDLIAFFFYDIVNEKYIPFRATIKGINDTTTAHWDELRFIGRADQVYTYNGFVRSLAFQFTIVITSLADLLPTWQKINYMKTSLKPSGYTMNGARNQFNRFIIPPMFTLTVGDMYKYQPIVMTNFSINIPENAGWETLNESNSTAWEYLHNDIKMAAGYSGKYAQLPKEVDISVTCNLLEKERAMVGNVDFGHAPLNSDGILLPGESGKPYMPSPSEFSKGIAPNQLATRAATPFVGAPT